METVSATDLKLRLGELLDLATVQPVAIERHGRVVAYLVPARAGESPRRRHPKARGTGLTRAREARLVELVADGDLRPSRWRRAGDPRFMAGFAAFLGSVDEGNRARLFALAERLQPGSSTVTAVQDWLHESGVEPSRLLPMLDAARREKAAERR
jgi:antitoxin (DNA-binding transcriptional repressor) of toxin-antitoxin stability system